jgi:acyl-coenzyme A synthetase/AMP-(fatty) acid ligase
MDPMAPAVRHAEIARDCSAAGLVASSALAAPLLRDLGEDAPRVVVCTDPGAALPTSSTVRSFDVAAERPADDPGLPLAGSDLATILYTSGPAGPRGVTHTHEALAAVADSVVATLGITGADRLAVHAPLHFSLSAFTLWPAMRVGATAVLVLDEESGLGADLARVIRDEAVTVWISAPFALTILGRSAAPDELRSLRIVAFGGARFLGRDVRRLQRLLPREVELWQLMGSTEAMGICRFQVRGPLDEDRPVPLGDPFDGVEALIVTDEGRPATSGEEGELFVLSPTVMRGYWGRPELTADILVPNPVDPNDHRLVCRTGDRVRVRADGRYEFAGRRDRMVKTRGSRVDLAEVEAAIATLPGVRELAVVAVPHAEWGVEIVAVVAPRSEAGLTDSGVKASAIRRLPRFMVPTRVAFAERLPRTPSGAIDRDRIAADLATDR